MNNINNNNNVQLFFIFLVIIICFVLLFVSTCTTEDEPFFEAIHDEIPPDLVQIMLNFVEQRDQINNILQCTDVVYLKKPDIKCVPQLMGMNELKRFTYQKDGSGMYLWTGYNKQFHDPAIYDVKVFERDPYVINNLSPVVQITSSGKTRLIAASLADYIRFVGTYSYNDLFNGKKLTIKDERPNLLIKLLQLRPISYHEFMKRRQYVIERSFTNTSI